MTDDQFPEFPELPGDDSAPGTSAPSASPVGRAAAATPTHEEDEPTRLYLHLKEVWSGRRQQKRRNSRTIDPSDSVPFGKGRDPHSLGSTLGNLTDQLGWSPQLSQSEVLLGWPALVGPELADHATAVDLADGVLMVQCDSTAWATQLRLMRSTILERLANEYPDAKVESIRFIGPDVPSWKHGFRSVPGRGPRDTYG